MAVHLPPADAAQLFQRGPDSAWVAQVARPAQAQLPPGVTLARGFSDRDQLVLTVKRPAVRSAAAEAAKAPAAEAPKAPAAEADPDIKSPPRKIVIDGQDYTALAQRLDQDPDFAKLRDRNAVAALAWLFEAPTLPGTTAKARMAFVNAYLADPATHDLPFRVRLPDTGFKPPFSDGALWPISHQGAHFFSAVKLGLEPNALLRTAYKWAVIGHEQVGDERGNVLQILRGSLGCVFGKDGRRFDDAVQAAIRGDYETVRARSAELVPLPEAPGAWTQKQERVGNSQQDMRLTAYGWALAELVRTDRITTPAQVAAWIHENIEAR